MYLFTRSCRFGAGATREVTSFIGEVTAKARQETGLDIHAWAATMSPEFGRVVWATFAEDLEHLQQANDKLLSSDAFVDLADAQASLLIEPMSDLVAQVVAGDPDPDAPTPSYITSAQAVAANGHLRRAFEGGVEIAEAATRITGASTLFLVGATGSYGGCAWVSGYTDIGALDRAEAALLADDGWVDLIDRVGPSYAPGASQAVYRLAA